MSRYRLFPAPPPALIFALMAALAGPAVQAQDDGPETGTWDFAATLDGKAIGRHRFVVGGPEGAREVDSRAQFDVRLLGISVYRYQHHAREVWQGDCLRELLADTNDDGEVQRVTQHYDDGCLMGFAYWNPRLVQQQQLVDPQTGVAGAVRFQRLPDAAIEVRGQKVPARGWRLLATTQRITVWYAADSGRWIALDADAKGGRRLSYRLPPLEPAP